MLAGTVRPVTGTAKGDDGRRDRIRLKWACWSIDKPACLNFVVPVGLMVRNEVAEVSAKRSIIPCVTPDVILIVGRHF